MTITPKIYIGSYNVARGTAFGYEHAYLYFDPDADNDQDPTTGTGMQIIRGGPDNGDGYITVEAGIEATASQDRFDEGFPWGVKTPEDRNFRIILEGPDTATAWNTMVQFAATLGAPHPSVADLYVTPFDYEILGPNSNSVTNTVLNAVGINFSIATPYVNGTTIPQNPVEFPAHLNFLDGNGDDSFFLHAYSGVDGGYSIHDNIGEDLFVIERGAKAALFKTDGVSNGDDNTVALLGFNQSALRLQTSVNDLIVRLAGATILDSPIYVHGQYDAGNPLLLTTLKITETSGSVIKTINLKLLSEGDIDSSVSLLNIFTSYTGHGDIMSGSGNDRLYGDGAANILRGERGDDVIRGGAGTDTYAFSFGDGNDTLIDDWAEGDTIALDFAVTRDMIDTLVSGSDLIVSIDGVGSLTIKDMAASATTFVANHIDNVIYEATTAVPSTGAVQWGTEVFNPSTGMNERQDLNDTVNGAEFSNDHLEGRNGNDILSGLSGDDYLDGGFGSGDQLYGDAGDDWLIDEDGGQLYGGADNDTLVLYYNGAMDGGAGNDLLDATGAFGTITMNGGDDNDTLQANGGGNFTMNGGTGEDIIYASGSATFTIHGGDDDDIVQVQDSFGGGHAIVNGGAGNDWLYLSEGDEIIVSSGDDVVYVPGGGVLEFGAGLSWGGDVTAAPQANARDLLITHPDGTVLIKDYFASTSGWSARFGPLGTSFDLQTHITSLDYTTSTEAVYFEGESASTLALIETGAGSDDITANAAGMTVNTAAGQDKVTAMNGNHTINTGADADTIVLGSGNNTVSAGSGNDSVTAGNGNNDISTSDGDDVIDVGSGNNDIDAGSGNDDITVDGGDGDIDAGDGNDTILSGATGSVDGGDGNDNIQVLVSFSTASVVVHGDDGDDVINAYSGSGDLSVYGDAGNDDITAQSSSTIYGGDGNDGITLASGSTAYGGSGDDTFTINGDDNIVDGGTGTNTVRVIGNDNRIVFNGGYTSVVLDSALVAGTIIDFGVGESYGSLTFSYVSVNRDLVVTSSTGTLVLKNYGADESLWKFAFGGAGTTPAIIDTTTTITGDSVYIQALANTNDTITTGSLGDTIYAYGGNDIINAGAGSNTIWAGSGNDIITAIGGAFDFNQINGEDGNDVIYSGAGGNFINGGAGNDEIHGGGGNDNINGGDGANLIYGDAGGDTITGGTDADTIYGGNDGDTISGMAGADMLYGEAGGDTINAGDGNDTLYGGTGNDTLRGDNDNDTLYGEADSDQLFGGAGHDILDGGAGNDLMAGGAGDDTYYVDSASDGVVENSGEGTDTIISSVSITTLAANVEKITFTGSTGRTITGNALNNVITGTSGNDTINGGDGNDTLSGSTGGDTMAGGAGDDIYYVDNAGDTTTENAGEGTDTVITSISWILDDNFENGQISGSIGRSLYGNSLNNTLTGSTGSDTLNGGAGNDTMIGGFGNDSYYVDSALDSVVENSGEGTDTVYTSVDYTLGANLENLTVTGSTGRTVTGNALVNSITGSSGADTLNGGAGNDSINGGTGNDMIDGGADNDTLNGGIGVNVIHGGAGNDVFTAATNINSDYDTIYGDDGNDTVYAGWGNDIIFGGNGNDIINGSLGSDTIHGNDGDDVIHGDDDAFLVATDDTIYGDDGNDTLYGDTGNDILNGGAGNDILNGGQDQYGDTMAGGAGDDIYYVDSSSDVVTENSGEGTDIIYSAAGYFAMGDHIENLVLTGTSGHTGIGNASNNVITGTSGTYDFLYGGNGNDTLTGGNGADYLYGEGGADQFVYFASNLGTGVDSIEDFSKSSGDTINIAELMAVYDPLQHAINDFVSMSVASGHTTIKVDRDGAGSAYSAQDVVTVKNTTWTDVAAMIGSGDVVID